MAKLAPIGSIVQINDVKLVVIGHRMARDGRHASMCYLLVPYPLGFVSESSLSLTPAHKVDRIVFSGFSTRSGEEHLEGLCGVAEAAKDVDYDDYADAILVVDKFLKEEGAKHE